MNLIAIQYTDEEIEARRRQVRQRLLTESVRIRDANFSSISAPDALCLFRLYDSIFFNGELGAEVLRQSGVPVKLRISSTMTSAGGKTTQFQRKTLFGRKTLYEIAISGRLLLNSFEAGGRDIIVSGVACSDRVDALQRIMEHEIVHLAEWLVFGETSCARTRFMNLARRIFGHRKRFHELVTPRERAERKFAVTVGDTVHFNYQGQQLTGRVNRLGVRATVLVEHAEGRRYSDGRYYMKFYVPPGILKKHPLDLDLVGTNDQ
jgi:hypothetical protein